MATTADSESSPLLSESATAGDSQSALSTPPPAPEPTPATPDPATDSAAALPASPSALVRSGLERPKPARSVTFDPNPVTRTIDPSPSSSPPAQVSVYRQLPHGNLAPTASTPILGATGQASYGAASTTIGSGGPPVLAALNNRLRRRNSSGGVPLATGGPLLDQHMPKIGPQRSTKNAQKLKLLPNPDFGDDGPDEESGRDVYSQYTRIKDPTARRDAAFLGKADRDRLPRVTAYCTASTYNMDGLMRFLKGRGKTRGANPKLIDECIYTPYNYDYSKNDGTHNESDSGSGGRGGRGSKAAWRQRMHDAELAQHEQLEQERHELEGEHEGEQQQGQDGQVRQERRHSTGEIEDDSHSQHRRDDLIDLNGDGHNSQQHFQDEEAIIDYEDEGRRRQNGFDEGQSSTGHENNSDGYFEPQHEHQEYSQHHENRDHDTNGEGSSRSNNTVSGDGSGENGEHHQYHHQERHEHEAQEEDRPDERPMDLDTHVHTPEVFLFDYGVVVIWGMSEAHEERFLKELAKFEMEKLAPDDVEAEFFNFYYTREYQARIYNDFIALRDKSNYMTKLAIAHALAQSVKTSLFEELIAMSIDTCKDIPTQIALTGSIHSLSRQQINMQIGELFILRINIHLNGSVLDTPELFWVEPQLEPLYQAARSYLEMDQRVGLLTQRLDVIADLLAVLKEQLSHGHDEKLEWIVIVLIAAEILVAAINIVVDLYVGD